MPIAVNLTLDDLKVPGIPEYTPPFGTKKGDMESLTAMEVNNNVLMPYANRRPIILDENDTYLITGRIERDATFVFTANCMLQSMSQQTFIGVTLKFINNTESSRIVFINDIMRSVPPNACLVLEATDTQGHFKVSESSSSRITLGRNYTNSLLTERDLVEVFGIPGDRSLSSIQAAFAKLQEKSSAGDFSDLGLGDYIDIPSITPNGQTLTLTNNPLYENLRVQIIAFDYFKNYYNTTHHVVMQFKNCPFKRKINPADSNVGGYPAMPIADYLSTTFGAGLEIAMGISCLSIKQYFQTAATTWSNSKGYKVFLPTENQLIGHKGSSTVATDTVSYELGQFPYYAINPKGLMKNFNGVLVPYWTASPLFADSSYFAAVYNYGFVDYNNADDGDVGVAPVFCI